MYIYVTTYLLYMYVHIHTCKYVHTYIHAYMYLTRISDSLEEVVKRLFFSVLSASDNRPIIVMNRIVFQY